MWDIVVGFVKGALGIKSSYISSSSTYLGAGLAMYTGLFIWFLMIAALVKAGLSAFKGTEAEKMDPVDNVKQIFQQKQKQEQQRQRAIERANFQPDRINK